MVSIARPASAPDSVGSMTPSLITSAKPRIAIYPTATEYINGTENCCQPSYSCGVRSSDVIVDIFVTSHLVSRWVSVRR